MLLVALLLAEAFMFAMQAAGRAAVGREERKRKERQVCAVKRGDEEARQVRDEEESDEGKRRVLAEGYRISLRKF